MKTLVIVESPAKCKKIESYLGDGYKCVASYGHIRELQKQKGLSCIDVNNNFTPSFQISKHQNKNIQNLKSKILWAEEVLLATDDDREGEAIAWHICVVFKLPIYKTKRIIFHEITKTALQKAVQNPTLINMDKVYSQLSRQVLDFLVGYTISPILWKYIGYNHASSLSAGRCQTPALRLIYDNYCDIKNNPGKESYNISGIFTEKNINFHLDKNIDKKSDVELFLEETVNHNHIIEMSDPKKLIKKSPEPFTTSSLQQKASNFLHFSPKQTMASCQILYEAGYITYMRTDSKFYSVEFINSAKKYINSGYGDKYISDNIDLLCLRKENNNSTDNNDTNKKTKKTTKGNKNKESDSKAQEAHEAIRPTNILKLSLDDSNNKKITTKEIRLYRLIWENTVQSCMSDAIYNSISITIKAPFNYKYKNTEESVVFDGWTIIGNNSSSSANYDFFMNMLFNNKQPSSIVIPYKSIKADYTLKETKQHYTEAKLVSLLEKKGIGRPSTFSSIISKIQERGYVKKYNIEGRKIKCIDFILEDDAIEEKVIDKELGKENNKLVLQPVGLIVIQFLIQYFSNLFNYDYTKMMEDDLDVIASGNKVWYDFCNTTYKDINNTIDNMTVIMLKDNANNPDISNSNKNKNLTLKNSIKLDDKYTFRIAKYGPVIEYIDDTSDTPRKKQFLKVKKNIDIQKVLNGELKFDDIVDNQDRLDNTSNSIGTIDDIPIIIKNGKYGLYTTFSGKNYSLKSIGKDIADINIDDVKSIIEGEKNGEKNINQGVVRQINNDYSIRNGKYGHYIYYKTDKMKSPKFYPLKNCKLDYLNCDIDVLLEWIDITCK